MGGTSTGAWANGSPGGRRAFAEASADWDQERDEQQPGQVSFKDKRGERGGKAKLRGADGRGMEL